MNKFFGHLSTVAKHRHKVFLHCCKAGIPFQGLTHDLSKFSPTEFIPSVKHYQGTRSPNEGEREDYGYSLAWMHHKGRNRHHFEYWTDYDPVTRLMTPVRMPEKYVVEMFCDRVAASKTYKGKDYRDTDPLAYFMRAKPRRRIHPESSDLLEKLLTTLAEEGESAAFTLAKEIVGKK